MQLRAHILFGLVESTKVFLPYRDARRVKSNVQSFAEFKVVSLVDVELVLHIFVSLEDRKQLHFVGALLLPVDRVCNYNRRIQFVMLSCKAVSCDVLQVKSCELEMIGVHLKKLVHAVKEEDEEGRIVLAVVDVWPGRHMQPL